MLTANGDDRRLRVTREQVDIAGQLHATRGCRLQGRCRQGHHFELKGWPEPRVIVRFWIITVILVLVGLATLKLR